jgi:hypothetical protein
MGQEGQSEPNAILKSETAIEEQSAKGPETPSTQPTGTDSDKSGISIDALSKWIAVGLVFVYVSGFLITSLCDFRYGFSEMNPLRPRILAAGGWFSLFLAVPYAFVREWTKHSLWNQELSKWHKAALLLYTYYLSCQFIMLYSALLFSFDETNQKAGPMPSAWKIALVVVAFLVVAVLASAYYSRIPRWLVATSIFLFFGWIVWGAYSAMFIKNTFQPNAPTLWMLGVGGIVYVEMRNRAWRPRLGNWPQTLVGFLERVS